MFLNCYSESEGKESQKVRESTEYKFKKGAVLSDVPHVTMGKSEQNDKGHNQWNSEEP